MMPSYTDALVRETDKLVQRTRFIISYKNRKIWRLLALSFGDCIHIQSPPLRLPIGLDVSLFKLR